MRDNHFVQINTRSGVTLDLYVNSLIQVSPWDHIV